MLLYYMELGTCQDVTVPVSNQSLVQDLCKTYHMKAWLSPSKIPSKIFKKKFLKRISNLHNSEINKSKILFENDDENLFFLVHCWRIRVQEGELSPLFPKMYLLID